MSPKSSRIRLLPAVALAVGTSSVALSQEVPAVAGSRPFRGKVMDTKLVTLIDRKTKAREQHLLAKLNIPDTSGEDRVGIVDLGPVSRIRATGVELHENAEVTGEGVRGRINDKPVLVALSFSANGAHVDGGAVG